MHLLPPILAILALLLPAAPAPAGDVVLVIHGGAGAPARAELTAEKEAAVRAELTKALRAGFEMIRKGGTALDAVTAPVVILEDSPLFNAGRGAALNSEGKAELDAAIMAGDTLRAGAVAGLHRTRNPVLLARAVMEKSPHVMMIGDGAEQFGRAVGMRMVEPAYFITRERQRDLERARAAEKGRKRAGLPARLLVGTVGAVALDAKGRLAAATSTGGTTNKRYGRVGDSPVIGAGTWADGRCGVSATGTGEYFIRVGAAHDLCARVTYRNEGIAAAAQETLDAVAKIGGDGGLIALDAKGNVAMPFNTDGMYRGTITRSGRIRIDIYRP
jgi:beta-aspartyl-peptidase (threonine type)